MKGSNWYLEVGLVDSLKKYVSVCLCGGWSWGGCSLLKNWKLLC